MMRVTLLLIYIFSFLFFSCQEPTIETVGGTAITLDFDQAVSPTDLTLTLDALKNRFASISPYPKSISTIVENNLIHYKLPGVTDTAAVRSLTLQSRMMKLCHAIPTKDFAEVRTYLSPYVVEAESDKPYKAASVIGYVHSDDKEMVTKIMSSDSFKIQFPQVAHSYFGVEEKGQHYALFMEVTGSAFIDETMYSSVDKYIGDDPEVGIMSLQLKPEFSKNLGPLTGNDSTYLLHIFDNEVYISKIIEPYIEGPSFSMKGAFSRSDIGVLTTIWKNKPLTAEAIIEAIVLIEK